MDFFGNLWDVLPDVSTRVGSALLMHPPSQRYLIGPSTWLLSRKQNNLIRMYCLFSWAFVQPFIPPELGAAGILEAPIFSAKIGSGGAHKANRFLARLFFFFPGSLNACFFSYPNYTGSGHCKARTLQPPPMSDHSVFRTRSNNPLPLIALNIPLGIIVLKHAQIGSSPVSLAIP